MQYELELNSYNDIGRNNKVKKKSLVKDIFSKAICNFYNWSITWKSGFVIK